LAYREKILELENFDLLMLLLVGRYKAISGVD
jgi:hypothetical protein